MNNNMNEKIILSAGIEPAPSAWKADILPLNYDSVQRVGFEPTNHKGEHLKCTGFDRFPIPANLYNAFT